MRSVAGILLCSRQDRTAQPGPGPRPPQVAHRYPCGPGKSHRPQPKGLRRELKWSWVLRAAVSWLGLGLGATPSVPSVLDSGLALGPAEAREVGVSGTSQTTPSMQHHPELHSLFAQVMLRPAPGQTEVPRKNRGEGLRLQCGVHAHSCIHQCVRPNDREAYYLIWPSWSLQIK